MAKDDYEVILYRLLVYLYGCLKREIMFETATFHASVSKDVKNDAYFSDILRMAQDEGLIEGLTFANAWGGESILISDICNARITPSGIRYLKENGTMKRIGDTLKESVDIISKLAAILQLF